MNAYRAILSTVLVALPFLVSPAASQSSSVAAKGDVATGTNGMATTAHPLASNAAIQMLRKGGNAVDAAVAAAFAIGVVEPDGSGIGGGGGMLIYLAKPQKSVYINYYPQASARVKEVDYDSRTDNRSPKAILIPGNVAGLTTALEKFGTLPLSVVLEPAIRYAEDGFPVDQTLAQITLDNAEFVQKYPATAAIYTRDGFPLAEGDTIRQPALAQILKAIAEQGRKAFYTGPFAEAMAKGIQEQGGMLTVEDLATYEAQVTEPVRGSYRGYDIISAAPPQSGISIIEALNILENEKLAALGHYSTSADALHIMAEAMRRMYADRTAYLDDPRTGRVPVAGMCSKEYALTRFNDINRAMADPPEYRKTKAGNPIPFGGGTPKPGERSESREDPVQKKAVPVSEENPVQNEGSQPKAEKAQRVEQYRNMSHRLDRSPLPRTTSRRASPSAAQFAEGGHTTHLSAVDKDGNVVSLTQTLGTFFGSGLVVEGVLFNCSMANFSPTLSINTIGPNRQPRSSIAPTILMKNGAPFLSVGSPGAARIEATIIELIVNIIDYGMDAGTANQAPRFFCQKNDDYLHLESRIGEDVQAALRKKGHSLRVYGEYDLFFGGAQLILFDQKTGTLYGSADPRRGGVAIGY